MARTAKSFLLLFLSLLLFRRIIDDDSSMRQGVTRNGVTIYMFLKCVIDDAPNDAKMTLQ